MPISWRQGARVWECCDKWVASSSISSCWNKTREINDATASSRAKRWDKWKGRQIASLTGFLLKTGPAIGLELTATSQPMKNYPQVEKLHKGAGRQRQGFIAWEGRSQLAVGKMQRVTSKQSTTLNLTLERPKTKFWPKSFSSSTEMCDFILQKFLVIFQPVLEDNRSSIKICTGQDVRPHFHSTQPSVCWKDHGEEDLIIACSISQCKEGDRRAIYFRRSNN